MTKAVQTILYVSQRMPWPRDSGGNIRSYHVLKGLGAWFDVSLVASAQTDEDAEQGRRALAPFCRSIDIVSDRKRDTPTAKASSFIASLPRQLPAFVVHNYNRRIAAMVRSLAQERRFDLVHLNHLDTAPYLDHLDSIPFAIDTHNLLFQFYTRRAASGVDVVRKMVFRIEARRLLRYEMKTFRSASMILTCSEPERESLLALNPDLAVQVIPNGVDTAFFSPWNRKPGANKQLLFVGDMAYPPNHDAVMTFISEILPQINNRVPDAHLVVVGRKPRRELLRLAKANERVTVTGFVQDVRQYFRESDVFLVPVTYGSGTRLKILSAFSSGLPTVSTSVGAEGIKCRSGHDILIEDQPTRMAEAVIRVLTNPEVHERLSRNCIETASREYDWKVIEKRLQTVYSGLAGR